MEKYYKDSMDGYFTGLAVVVGVVVGVLINNIGLWIALGLCFGVAIEQEIKSKSNKNK